MMTCMTGWSQRRNKYICRGQQSRVTDGEVVWQVKVTNDWNGNLLTNSISVVERLRNFNEQMNEDISERRKGGCCAEESKNDQYNWCEEDTDETR